jgi:hypothetical protein
MLDTLWYHSVMRREELRRMALQWERHISNGEGVQADGVCRDVMKAIAMGYDSDTERLIHERDELIYQRNKLESKIAELDTAIWVATADDTIIDVTTPGDTQKRFLRIPPNRRTRERG